MERVKGQKLKPHRRRIEDSVDVKEPRNNPAFRGILSFLEESPEEALVRIRRQVEMDRTRAFGGNDPAEGAVPTQTSR